MQVSQIITDIRTTIREIVNALSNRLHSRDNFGPDGEKGQVLTSLGKDDPPDWRGVDEALRALKPGVLTSIIGSSGGGVGGSPPLGATIIRETAGWPGWDGQDGEDSFIPGPAGPRGEAILFGNLDGGTPDSIYGGVMISPIDGGGV